MESAQTQINKYMPFIMEIRKRLLFAGALFLVASIAGFMYYQKIIAFVLDFFSLQGVNIVFTTPFQFFSLSLNCAILVGVIFTLPVLIHQLLSFLKPALKPTEYAKVVTIMPFALLLFIFGFVYGVVMMKYLLQIFYQISITLKIGNVLDVESLLSQIMMTGLLMGIAFLFPIAMTILMQLGIIKYQLFLKQRPLAYLVAVIFVIFLPPPDLLSDVVLVAPLVILFEITLILNRVFLKSHLI